MSRFKIDDSVVVYTTGDVNITITVDKRPQIPMEEWTATRLAKAYKKAYKTRNTERMFRIRRILQEMHGEDIYVSYGKVYLMTYNGCPRRI